MKRFKNKFSRIKRSINYPFGFNALSSSADPLEEKITPHEFDRLNDLSETRNLALRRIHDPEAFTAVWNTERLHPETRRWMRKLTQIQTLNALYNGFYRLPDRTKVQLDKERMRRAAINTKQYTNDHVYDENLLGTKNENAARIVVLDADCIDAAIWLKSQYPDSHPLILNMASANHPGGGWRNGAGAQEENLHRRSNMCQCLEDPYLELESERDWNYHVPEFGGIYSPNVAVFRGSERLGYPFFTNGPIYFSFIAVAAYSHPPIETSSDGELRLSGRNFVRDVMKKFEAIFKIALENKHDVLILSALGCGAYRNPPRHIAQLFQQIIAEKYMHSFKCIAFAIINDHNAMKTHNPEGNITPFADTFKVEVTQLHT